ncbi:unnamed protein product [Caenorhabditis bovis]|uniref:Uncharacterized protein n=1 Tax=Caenorhabditis bovis TaxID=2654633 RepID=A0A8S1EMJ4_9PELO|nr:unnamed protein product [Caenorhabditis bovis]
MRMFGCQKFYNDIKLCQTRWLVRMVEMVEMSGRNSKKTEKIRIVLVHLWKNQIARIQRRTNQQVTFQISFGAIGLNGIHGLNVIAIETSRNVLEFAKEMHVKDAWMSTRHVRLPNAQLQKNGQRGLNGSTERPGLHGSLQQESHFDIDLCRNRTLNLSINYCHIAQLKQKFLFRCFFLFPVSA